MGVLDEPWAKEIVGVALPAVDNAAAANDVRLSPFAREILGDFLTSVFFEPLSSAQQPADPQALFEQLSKLLPGAIRQARDTYGLAEREGDARLLLTSVDVFHWMAQFGLENLKDVICPWQ